MPISEFDLGIVVVAWSTASWMSLFTARAVGVSGCASTMGADRVLASRRKSAPPDKFVDGPVAPPKRGAAGPPTQPSTAPASRAVRMTVRIGRGPDWATGTSRWNGIRERTPAVLACSSPKPEELAAPCAIAMAAGGASATTRSGTELKLSFGHNEP
eukprot:scaffold310822_cov28-Tisochrysis_lutea.AAC.1